LRNRAATANWKRVRKAAKALPLAEQLEWALDFCSARGLRRTKALRALLAHLLKARRPMRWATLSRDRFIAKVCDPSSAFRVLVKLEEIGLVRRMGSPDRSYYFTLTLPGEHSDHLICTGCGKIENLDIKCPVEKIEKRIVTRSGYRSLYHELDFFGVCPACQPA
jgi:Fe2+ or Zn2+ uptake regulation protein